MFYEKWPYDVVISAAPFEIKALKEKILSLNPRSKTLWLSCGIGSLKAKENASFLAEMSKEKNVLFIGTCGLFEPFRKLELFLVKHIHWLPTGVRLKKAYLVNSEKSYFNLKKNPLLPKNKKKLKELEVFCSPSISLSPTPKPKKQFAKFSGENLELFSCLKEIDESAKSLTVILGSTNKIGKTAHKEWKKNFLKSSYLCVEYLTSILK